MSKVKIIIIEDDFIVAKDLKNTLHGLGYEVTSIASTAEQALKKTKENRPDLALVDIMLKGKKSGLKAARKIRSALNIPIIYVTAYADKETMEEARLTEPEGYLIKPIDEKQLNIAIQIALYKHAYERQLEKSLRLSQKRYRQLVNHISEGIIVVDESGIISFINDRFLEIHGYTQEEVLGRPVTDFLDEESINKFKKELTQRKKGKHGPYELLLKRKDGQNVITVVSPEPIFDEKGHYKGSLAVLTDITERRQIERELVKSQSELRQLSNHLTGLREKERKRIAHAVHDDLGPLLTVLKMELSRLYEKLPLTQKQLKGMAKSLIDQAERTLKSVQRISTELRPRLLDEVGLIPAIKWQVQEFQNYTGIKCKLNIMVQDSHLERDLATAIFRILQEGLTNAARHAKASRVEVSLKERNSELMFNIRDNGKGITEKQISDPKSFGLMEMQERILSWKGKCEIKGIKNKGTTIAIRLPLDKKVKSPD